ncbi:MAG: caspase family protein [Oscillospiraceae bacterium]|nr:caspase family protein [Oscillospiraceae bacterium]
MSFLITSILFLYVPVRIADYAAGAESQRKEYDVRYRALLIACDDYITYPDTAPTSHNNLIAMEALLENDIRGFTISRQDGITQSAAAFAQAAASAFRDADEDDVSYIYISAHGSFDDQSESPNGGLILSDGAEEERLTVGELRGILDKVPGVKMLIVDACYSGAIIGRGMAPDSGINLDGSSAPDAPERGVAALHTREAVDTTNNINDIISGTSYKALVSSGGSEPSWYWRGSESGPPLGSSYFTAALAQGAGLYGEYPADRDRDGSITLAEMAAYLRIACAASTVQSLPQDDGFVLFKYDPLAESCELSALTGFVFDRVTLDADHSAMDFSFTVREPTRVGYQLVAMKDGVWDWAQANVWLDSQECPDTLDGSVQIGRKKRTIQITDITPRDWGYVLLNVIRFDAEEEPVVCASRVISVQPQEGDPGLRVASLLWEATRPALQESPPQFDPADGDLPIFVSHSFPCSLTLSVAAEDGTIVRWLAVSQQTRPQGLTPDGSLFYWNGRDASGDMAPPGLYIITARTSVGEQTFRAQTAIVIVGE